MDEFDATERSYINGYNKALEELNKKLQEKLTDSYIYDARTLFKVCNQLAESMKK